MDRGNALWKVDRVGNCAWLLTRGRCNSRQRFDSSTFLFPDPLPDVHQAWNWET